MSSSIDLNVGLRGDFVEPSANDSYNIRLESVEKKDFTDCFVNCKRRCSKSLRFRGDYFEGDVKLNYVYYLCLSNKPVSYTHLDVYKRQIENMQ